jgi:hypothetical protein
MTLKPAEIGPKRASLEYIFAALLDAPPLAPARQQQPADIVPQAAPPRVVADDRPQLVDILLKAPLHRGGCLECGFHAQQLGTLVQSGNAALIKILDRTIGMTQPSWAILSSTLQI